MISETWFLVNSRLGGQTALQFWDWTAEGPAHLIGVPADQLESARSIAHAYEDTGFSFVDCTTIATMVSLGIEEVFTFDQHFDVFRYGSRNERALDRVPEDS